ncbi:SHOCT domain-containing protein [Streptomyces armeniacus]|uniref:SHOCT domain-containing protein n=1 Tax=Streptomyces armeniacus TaxID=83291 RepID=A0A345XK56_9ACTN|nr:SHOCT domain-containing protein [Streptomyces armeniacus]AXK32022.1 SHOCT domain-containing protein [Streptomyces armeniacus]
MNTMAHWADSGGPGPWILLFPLMWAAVIFGLVTLARRTVWRGRGPWQGRGTAAADPANAPLELLANRFAAGEIDENEYWMRLSVLKESKGGSE